MNGEKYQNISDAELLENFYLDYNNQWLGILFQRYTLLLLGVCMKYLKNEEEAKDSVQQIFLKALTELNKYKVEYFKSWIYMVAKNYCLMKIRDSHGRQTADVTENLPVFTDQEHEERLQHIERNNRLELMNHALKELAEEQQQCIIFFYLEKKSYQEIAEQTGFSMLQVKSYIQNGKRNLKNLLDKKLNQK